MSFLTVNGVEIQILSASVAEVVIGDKTRAFDGAMRSTVRAWKRQWKMSTGPLAVSDAQVFKSLVRGQGDVWSFDTDVYSAKGAAITGTAPTVTSSGKFGSYADCGANGQTFPNTSVARSFLWWQKSQDGTTWHHYSIVTSDGIGFTVNRDGSGYITTGSPGADQPALSNAAVVGIPIAKGDGGPAAPSSWLNFHFYALNDFVTPATPNGFAYRCTSSGTSGGSAPTWPTTYGATVTDNGAVWTCVGPTAAKIDDVVILPYAVPANWLSALAAATVPWGSSPRLTAAGDFVGGSVTATGEVQDGALNMMVYPTGFGTGQAFEFLLEEV